MRNEDNTVNVNEEERFGFKTDRYSGNRDRA